MVSENSAEVREAKSGELVRVTEKEIEPLLEGAKPFFGGKEEMTLAEVSSLVFSSYPFVLLYA